MILGLKTAIMSHSWLNSVSMSYKLYLQISIHDLSIIKAFGFLSLTEEHSTNDPGTFFCSHNRITFWIGLARS